MNRVNTSNDLPILSDWFLGTNDTGNTLLTSTFFTPQSAIGQTSSYSGSNLVSFIQKQYASSAFNGLDLAKNRYIFFRLSPTATSPNYYTNYLVASSRNGTRAWHPTLALTISGGISNVAGRMQFSFNLPQNSVTSAGVYNTSTGALIRHALE